MPFIHAFSTLLFESTGGPRYMREIGTPKIGLHVINLHIKRPRITVNLRIGARKRAISQSHICKIAGKKAAYNEGHLYFHLFINETNIGTSKTQCNTKNTYVNRMWQPGFRIWSDSGLHFFMKKEIKDIITNVFSRIVP